MSEKFSAMTPLYHEQLDDWGFAPGTLVWDASGNFTPVQEIEKGDRVFGIGFRVENDYVETGAARKVDNIKQFWRPVMTEREVLAITTVTARSWQLTFGTEQKAYESRRLVAGGITHVSLHPVHHREAGSKPLIRCCTALENQRVQQEFREAQQLDPEWSEEAGEPRYRPTPYTGTPRGEQVTIIPYEHYGGLMNLMRTDIRPYRRYEWAQAREIVPLQAETTLYQLHLRPDTSEKLGVLEGDRPRCNIIAQTPFAKETKKRTIHSDRMSREVLDVDDTEEFEREWDEWVKNRGNPQPQPGGETTYETTAQGMYYDSKESANKSKALNAFYGIENGWLNGGILCDLPAPKI